MTRRSFLAGQTVVIRCESCEPELAKIVSEAPPCPDCSGQVYRLQTDLGMIVLCCATILHPLH
jgi:Zn finger protein HypA/HybF involved in hydrogenase expression